MKLGKQQQGKATIIPGCLLDHAYFKDNYELIATELSKQNVPDADPKAIQQIVFQGVAGVKLRLYTILERPKETVLEFSKERAIVLQAPNIND